MLRKISLYACAAALLVGCKNDNKNSSDPSYISMCTIRSPYTTYYVPRKEINFNSSTISFEIGNGAKRVIMNIYSMECVKVIEGEEK
jgi:hypothetical protein